MTDGNARTTNYTYDSVNRLVSDGVVSYTYDDIGNRKTMTDWRGVTNYEYDALNRLTKITDSKGNMLGYTYDGVEG